MAFDANTDQSSDTAYRKILKVNGHIFLEQSFIIFLLKDFNIYEK